MVKKVLIFRKRLLPYSETFIADQGSNLKNYEAQFVGLQEDITGIHLLDNLAVNILDRHTDQIKLSKLYFRLGLGVNAHWFKSIQIDHPKLIHAHFLNDGIDAVSIAERLGIPSITTLHGHDITKQEKHTFLKKGSQFLFNKVDKVIAVSNYIADQALQKGCPENKLVQHSIGINLERFQQDKEESDSPSLLFVGRLVEKKGVTFLLKAMHLLSKNHPEMELTIVGDGHLKAVLQQEALDKNLLVNFVGKQNAEQIRQLMSKSWIFVAPSITADNGDAEGLGMVFLEAQALQTPVVSFASGGVIEAVENESTGLLCGEKDVNSLAENIDTLLKSETLRREFGQRGRERIEYYFDVKKQCRILETIYDDVCHQA